MLTRGLPSRESWCIPCPTPADPRARQSQDGRGLIDLLTPRVPSSPVQRSASLSTEVGAEGKCSPSSAFQDRDFLENEQFFLETLKKASYNMASHSA